MKISRLVLASALIAVWAALPLAAYANNDEREGDEENVEIHKSVRRGDGGGHEGPRGQHGADPAMKEKFEKMRELKQKIREIGKTMRQGTDAEKAAAKTEARKVLGEMFDAKLAMETAMLAKMEKHVAELREKVAKKKTSREKAIESRLSRLSGEDDDW